jgi:hypothetical protein
MKRISVLVLVLIVFVWAQQSRPQDNEESRSSKLPTNFIVVDSTGKAVGPVIGVGETHSTAVAIHFQGSFLPVTVQRTSFLQTSLFFTSLDCSGQPFQDESGSPFPASAVGPGNMLFAASGPSQSITVGSTLFDGVNCFQTPPEPFTDAVPMAPVLSLNMFTPPFKVVSVGTREVRED